LRGPLPEFSLFWTRLNSASGEIFLNPLTNDIISDVQPSRDITTQVQLSSWLNAEFSRFEFNSTDNAKQSSLKAVSLQDSLAFFLRQLSSYKGSTPIRWLPRFSVLWATAIAVSLTPHGFTKNKRARSIKKRLSKRLVRRTQFRFWNL
jgi:hypothetical protein